MSIVVVTDSAATVPDDIAEKLGIEVVPIRILVGDRQYRDGELSHQRLLESDDEVTTSGPAPGEFLQAISGGEGAVILTVSHDLAESTHLSAKAAAATSEIPVQVIDTATAAGAQGLVVLAAARAAASGGSIQDVAKTARQVIDRVRLIATLPGLDHLARSGHVPGAAAWATRWMGLHLVVDLRGGRVRPLRPALSARTAKENMLAAWRATRPAGPAQLHVAGLHALDPEGAEELLARVREEVPPEEEFVGSFGTGMVVHSGPGVLGLAWWWEDGE